MAVSVPRDMRISHARVRAYMSPKYRVTEAKSAPLNEHPGGRNHARRATFTAYTSALAITMAGSTVIRTVPGGIVASQLAVTFITKWSSLMTLWAVSKFNMALVAILSKSRLR